MYLYRNKKNRNLYILIVFTVGIVLGVGYALLTNTLSITGNSKIEKNIWNVHFSNINVTDGSVSATQVPTLSNGTNINYTVSLDKPGDFYEFTVDVENEGTIDAMIGSISSTQLTEEEQKYLSYSYYFKNDNKNPNIFENRLLPGNTINRYDYGGTSYSYTTIVVRVEYKKNIETTDLLSEKQIINLNLSLNYVQANSNAFDGHEYNRVGTSPNV